MNGFMMFKVEWVQMGACRYTAVHGKSIVQFTGAYSDSFQLFSNIV